MPKNILNTPGIGVGTLIVFTDTPFTAQLYLSSDSFKMAYRVSTSRGSEWTEWSIK